MLRENNIRLIGIGLEELGYETFLDGKYFDGELYVDTRHEQYKTLGFKKYNFFNGFFDAFFNKLTKKAYRGGRKNNLIGDIKGNGLQLGGTLIIAKGGKDVILFKKMEKFGDYLEVSKVLEALNIDRPEILEAVGSGNTAPNQCDGNICQLMWATTKVF
ncbi:unnamed protein product [Allacma fusca]|uniref:Uncharacterized protein n=1 Tax=Allacma fusca TaxID=39272 RepID=A0A8J2LMY9_9HEXA|nr:unnamed protein product [Allacma fusca]